MNFVNTGVRAVGRRVRRQKNRLALVYARKAVERAETVLGRAGWQALAGDERVRAAFEDIQRHDERIAGTNADIARLEAQVHEQEAARAAARHEHAEAAARIEAERAPVEHSLPDLQTRLAGHGRALQEQNVRRGALNAQQTALLRQERRIRRAGRLLTDDERAAHQNEFDAGRASLAEQAALLAAARSQESEAAADAQERIKEVRAAFKGLDKRAVDAAAGLAARERAVAVAIGALHKQIAALRRQAARIEEEKDDSFLAIGRLLGDRDQPPEGQEEAFALARRHRQGYERLERLEHAWSQESRDADRQDLRLFHFVCVTLGILLVLGGLLAFSPPAKTDWLPRNTEAILTLDVKNFTDADFKSQEPPAWQAIWTGLVRTVAAVPAIDVRRQVSRITRALAPATERSPAVDCLLVEMRPSVSVESICKQLLTPALGFRLRSFNDTPNFHGVPLYEKGALAVAQIGPDTLAVGPSESVQALIDVRLGLRDDLKSDAQVFSEFQRLDANGAFRLVTYRPRELTDLTDPVLEAGLLRPCQSLGLTIDVREPVSAVFLFNAATAAEADEIARTLSATPDEVLRLQSVGPNLFIEPPVVRTHDAQVEWRFRMTAPAARELLQRVSRLEGPASGGSDVAGAAGP